MPYTSLYYKYANDPAFKKMIDKIMSDPKHMKDIALVPMDRQKQGDKTKCNFCNDKLRRNFTNSSIIKKTINAHIVKNIIVMLISYLNIMVVLKYK